MPLTNAQYDEIMRSYQNRQLRRQHLIAARKDEVGALSPRMAELDAEIARVGVSEAQQLLSDENHPLSDMRDTIASLASERKNILLSLGYPADYFDPPYECPECQDTGFIGSDRCRCFKQASINLIYAQSNLASAAEEESFAHFSLDYYTDSQFAPGTDVSSLAAAKNALSKCQRFTQDFDRTFQNILLYGDTGVGKTFLSNCTAKELLKTGHSVIYFSAHRLFDILAEHTFRKKGDGEPGCRNIFDCDLLIIDDLGTEMSNSFTTSQLFVCLNERISHRKSTLISSNLDLKDISSIYSERIFSRITSHFILLRLFGTDIRIQKVRNSL